MGRVATYGATFGSAPQVALEPFGRRILTNRLGAESSYIQYQRENYKRVAPDPEYWPKIFDKLGRLQKRGFSKERNRLRSRAPMLIALRRSRFCPALSTPVETFNLISNAELAVIPDAGHFTLSSEPKKVISVV